MLYTNSPLEAIRCEHEAPLGGAQLEHSHVHHDKVEANGHERKT